MRRGRGDCSTARRVFGRDFMMLCVNLQPHACAATSLKRERACATGWLPEGMVTVARGCGAAGMPCPWRNPADEAHPRPVFMSMMIVPAVPSYNSRPRAMELRR
jgi:hypothetical protein